MKLKNLVFGIPVYIYCKTGYYLCSNRNSKSMFKHGEKLAKEFINE